MKNPVLISTAAYDGYDLATAFKEISRAGVDLVEIAFIEGYTDPFTEDYFNDDNAAKIIRLLTEYNLRCPSFSSHVDLSRDGIVEVFKNRMAFAKKAWLEIYRDQRLPAAEQKPIHAEYSEIGENQRQGWKWLLFLKIRETAKPM